MHHILFCNESADILVLDLPASISRAQASTAQLRSPPARELPYTTPEPKAAKHDTLLSQIPQSERDYHRSVQHLACSALQSLQRDWHSPVWCHSRSDLVQGQYSAEPEKCLCNSRLVSREPSPPLVLSTSPNQICCPSAFTKTAVHNPCLHSADLLLSTHGRFLIPPECTFLHASIDQGLEIFEDAVHCLLPRGCFDLILFDPPWGNRSVRNSRAYHSAENQLTDPFEKVFPIVRSYLSDGGYVALWVTNKAAIRSRVLGICSSYGLVLHEEWIWLKVTARGEPISPIDGLWRKPYEAVMLFRQSAPPDKVSRRIGISVPDVHSRKPSLKSMFEQLLPLKYDALEVFARSLTAGWWSWGDEALKFQHESNWHCDG